MIWPFRPTPPRPNWPDVIATTVQHRQRQFRDPFPPDTAVRIMAAAETYGALTNPQMIGLIETEIRAIEATLEPWYPRRMLAADIGLEEA